jgi:O-antigen/teichoic acid export membrane protein
MVYSNLFLIRGAIWTIGNFGFALAARTITSVVLAHLLAPELFGIMFIVNSIRTGVELISDIGIGQNIVHNTNAERPEFYDTAWTLRLIRSLFLWLLMLAAAVPVARFYGTPIIGSIMPVLGSGFIIGALGSVAPYLAQKKIRFVRITIYEVTLTTFSNIGIILLAYFMPTIWALVFGALVATTAQSIASYFLLPNVRHRLRIRREYVDQIFSFGSWVFVSSIAYFLAMNFDRFYFGKIASFDVVGVYGIAKSLSELVVQLVLRVNGDLVFPLIAASQLMPRAKLRADLAPKRFAILLVGAAAFGVMITFADIVIKLLYDQRYQAAGWMLPVLLVGSWFSVLTVFNESTLLGLGKPIYSALSNSLKFLWLFIGLPFGYAHLGIPGVILVISTADIWRYPATFIGQVREHFSFARQDFACTLAMFVFSCVLETLRSALGFGTSFDGLLYKLGQSG